MCKWEGGTRPQASGRDLDNTPLLERMGRIEDILATIADRVGLQQETGAPLVKAGPTAAPERLVDALEVGPSTSGIAQPPASSSFSVLSTGMQATGADLARSELRHVLNILPDTVTVRRMCRYYFDEVDYMHYCERCVSSVCPLYSLSPLVSFSHG